jgi:Calcineurin-like phosphoesterase
MTSRRMLPVWLVAAAVLALVGLLLASWLRGGGVASPVSPSPSLASPTRSASAAASPSASATPTVASRTPAESAASLPPPTAVPSVAPPTAAPTAAPTPTPRPSLAPSGVLLAVGDTASCDNENDSAVAALAATLPGDIALVGDLAYPDGSAANFADCFDPVWGPLRSRLRPAPGNHEYVTSGASAYFADLGSLAGVAGQGWYAYDIGPWRVLSLNSNCGSVGCDAGSAQVAWLRAQLASAPGCTLAYWHHPRYSSGMHGDNAFVDTLWSTAVDGGVDLVLGGHDHDYERLTANGVREFVVGTGGRSLYTFPGGPSSHTEARTDSTYGLLKLTLGDGTYSWQFLPAGGGTYTDAGTGTCS